MNETDLDQEIAQIHREAIARVLGELYDLVEWIPNAIQETPVHVRHNHPCRDCGAILLEDGRCANCA